MGKGKHVFQDRRLDDLHKARISIEAGKRTYIKKALRSLRKYRGEIYRDPMVIGANARISKKQKTIRKCLFENKKHPKKVCVYKPTEGKSA